MRRGSPVLCALVLGLLTLLDASAQQDSAGVVTIPIGSEGDEVIEDILGAELAAALEDFQIEGAILAAAAPADPLTSPPNERRVTRLLSGLESEADVIAAAFYLLEESQLFVQFSLYDPASDVVLGGVLTRSRRGLTLFTSVDEAVDAFIPVVERYVEGDYLFEPPPGLVERVTIFGPQERSRVRLIDQQVGSVLGGQLLVPYTQFEVGTVAPVLVEKAGYHSFEDTVELTETRVELELPRLVPETRFDAYVYASYGFLPGFGLGGRMHITPDTFFVGLGHYRAFEPVADGQPAVRNFDTNIFAGRYILFPPGSLIRLSLSAGLGLIVTDVAGLNERDYTDFYLLLGDPSLEIHLGRLSFFLQPEVHYALGIAYNLLGRIWIRGPANIPPISLGARYSW